MSVIKDYVHVCSCLHTHTHPYMYTQLFSCTQRIVTEPHLPKERVDLAEDSLNAAFFIFCLQLSFINRFAKLMLNSLISGSY